MGPFLSYFPVSFQIWKKEKERENSRRGRRKQIEIKHLTN
jgi:hypothetical protein